MNRGVVRVSLGLLLGLALVGAGHAQTQTSIPVRFQGEWNSDPKHCGDRESGTNLIITDKALIYFEAGDEVLAVHPAELDGINILVDHEDYDGIERLSRTLILSDDHQKLSFTYGDGPESVVLRCPQGNQDGRQAD
ncbi:hypothetical protein [Brevundimonas sp. NPDC058933]|uniref:hypothetical protein n=1 Tax=Brevundimonas sp. NPDC058933 TaxID=3346673 RepID=UPI003BEF0AFD